MEANELRIRNIISDNFIRYKVAEISFGIIKGFSTLNGKDIYPDTVYSLNIENLQGIPLTEEILLKCGFIIKISDSFSYHFKANVIPTDILYLIKVCFYSDGKFMTVTVGNYDTKIQYLHELQNLIHALTGEELNIKL